MSVRIRWFALIVSVLFMASCGEDVLGQVDSLIRVVDEAPAKWQSAAAATIQQLEVSGTKLSHQVAEDLQHVIDETVELSHDFANCEQDIIGLRFRQTVEQLRYQHWGKDHGEPKPVPEPLVCWWSPDIVESTPSVPSLQVIGFNFTHFEEASGAPLQAEVRYDGETTSLASLPVAVESSTLLHVQTDGAHLIGIDPKRGPQLVLAWDSTKISGAKPVIGRSEIPVLSLCKDRVDGDTIEVLVVTDETKNTCDPCNNCERPSSWRYDRVKLDKACILGATAWQTITVGYQCNGAPSRTEAIKLEVETTHGVTQTMKVWGSCGDATSQFGVGCG